MHVLQCSIPRVSWRAMPTQPRPPVAQRRATPSLPRPQLVNIHRPVHLLARSHRLNPSHFKFPRFGSRFAILYSTQTAHATARPGALQRARQFLRDNPYTRFSLILCAVVFTGSLSFELFMKIKKKKSPEVLVYPPRVGHYIVARTDEVESVHQKVTSLRKRGRGILCVVGPAGSGKTELVRQYAEYFSEKGRKWWGRGAKPIVLYVNGSSAALFKSTLSESASNIGADDVTPPDPKESSSLDERGAGVSQTSREAGQTRFEELAGIARVLQRTLASQNLPWLIVVDGLRPDAVECFSTTFLGVGAGEGCGWGSGQVVVTTGMKSLPGLPEENHYQINPGLSAASAAELLVTLAGMRGAGQAEEGEVRALSSRLLLCPLAVALAGSTISLYSSHLRDSATSRVAVYSDVLSGALDGSDRIDRVLDAALGLYVEAAAQDPVMRHTFDLLGACDPSSPLPVSAIAHHLALPWFHLPPPPPAPLPETEILASDTAGKSRSFLSRLKAILGFSAMPTPDEIADKMAALADPVTFLRGSPLVSFRRYRRSGVELVHLQGAGSASLSALFLASTVPWLESSHLARSEEHFLRTAWLRSYRRFDADKSVATFRLSLPGVASPGVLTQNNFEKSPPVLPPGVVGTAPPPDSAAPSYAEYLHVVSHYHRMVESLTTQLRVAGGDVGDMQLRRYLQPHLRAISRYPLLSRTDALSCAHGILHYEAAALEWSREEAYERFERLLERQRALLRSGSPVLARTLTDMAYLKHLADDLTGAQHLLERALAIYEKLPPTTREPLSLDVGLTLSSLGIVLSELGEKERSRECLEAALVANQTPPPGGQISERQKKIVASSLTEVAHAYISLGQVDAAKRYVELSLMAHRNVYFEPHPEMVRALNVSSIVSAVEGDKRASTKDRDQAGKLQEKLNSRPATL